MYNIKKGVEQRMQDNINTLNKELVDAKISLDEIYLDPNNPRFTSLKWDDIPDQQISDASIQAATKRKLEEEFSIYKLVDNIQINGFLPIDRVIVKKFAENKYVVLEGNRRICAAKNIMELYKGNPEQVEESVVDSLLRFFRGSFRQHVRISYPSKPGQSNRESQISFGGRRDIHAGRYVFPNLSSKGHHAE